MSYISPRPEASNDAEISWITYGSAGVLLEPTVASPAAPTSGYMKLYFKSDGKLYKQNSAGVETEVGAAGAAALLLDQTTHQHIINGRPVFDEGLVLGLTPTVGTTEVGKLYWDVDWKTPICELEDNVRLQIGQETMAYVYNGTAGTISQGAVVYTSGTQGGVPSISLALGDADATSSVLGVVTSTTIAPTEYGYVTIRGHVNNMDTSAWSLNDVLYLSADTAGALTNVKPNTGDYDTRVGRVMLDDASTGRIYVNIVRDYRVGAVSAGAGVEMFPDDTPITASGVLSTYPIKTLSKTPVTTAEDVDTISVTAATSPVLYGTYLNTAPIGLTTIAGGVWSFDIWAGVSSATNTTSLTQNVNRVRPGVGTITTTDLTATSKTATASTGTPFLAANVDVGGTIDSDSFLQTPQGFYRILTRVNNTTITIEVPATYTNESTVAYSTHKKLFGVTTGEINNVATAGTPWTGLQLYTVTSVQGAFTVEATDTLASTFFGVSNGTRLVYFSHNGTTRYSHFSTPLVTQHNDLAGLQGGASSDYYHLTLAQATIATQSATTDRSGYLTDTDWDTFNGKASLTAPTFVTSITTPSVLVTANDAGALGASGTAFSDLFLASGGVINWNAGNATLTHSAGLLTSNVPLSLGTSNAFTCGSIELGAAADCTISRTGAGAIAVENVAVLTVAGGTMTGNIVLGENTSVQLDPAGSDDGKYTGITVTGTAGATVAFGDVVTLDKDDSRWELVDVSAAAAATGDARGLLGMAVSAGNDGDTITILLEGIIRADANFPTLTIGANVYASTTGDIVVAQPTTTDHVIRIIGGALTANEMFFRPDFAWITHT